jgi:hypothetical protein
MTERGYSLFGFYDQMHEWIKRSAALRRVNVAYLSPALAKTCCRPVVEWLGDDAPASGLREDTLLKPVGSGE